MDAPETYAVRVCGGHIGLICVAALALGGNGIVSAGWLAHDAAIVSIGLDAWK